MSYHRQEVVDLMKILEYTDHGHFHVRVRYTKPYVLFSSAKSGSSIGGIEIHEWLIN